MLISMDKITLIFAFVLRIFLANVVNDDNYVLFSDTISGENSLPGADGTLILLGTTLSKINLTDRTIMLSK